MTEYTTIVKGQTDEHEYHVLLVPIACYLSQRYIGYNAKKDIRNIQEG